MGVGERQKHAGAVGSKPRFSPDISGVSERFSVPAEVFLFDVPDGWVLKILEACGPQSARSMRSSRATTKREKIPRPEQGARLKAILSSRNPILSSRKSTWSHNPLSWTPRHEHILTSDGQSVWAHPVSLFAKHRFKPEVSTQPYVPPPAPPPFKRKAAREKKLAMTAAELSQLAAEMLAEVHAIEEAPTRKPDAQVRLGLALLEEPDALRKTLKQWDAKGKPLGRAELRIQVRNKLQMSSSEADQLFELWDVDRGGSLDEDELRAALGAARAAAEAWRAEEESDPRQQQAALLRERVQLAERAAEVATQVEEMERELAQFCAQSDARADVQLGSLLSRRRVKPGAICREWSTSRGVHAGELSKHDFGVAVRALGLQGMSTSDLNAVFDTYDADGGGYLDSDEARLMIKGLQQVADEAEHARWSRLQAIGRTRAEANRQVALVSEPMVELVGPVAGQQQQADDVGSASGGLGARRRKDKNKSAAASVGVSGAAGASDVGHAQSEAPSSSPALRIAAFFSDRQDRQQEVRETKHAAERRLMRVAAGRLQQLEAARAFTAWVDMADARRMALNIARAAMQKLMQPAMQRAWYTWTTFYEERRGALARVRHALHHFTMLAEIAAFAAWCEAVRGRQLCAIAVLQSARGQRARVARAFRSWLRQHTLRTAAETWNTGNPCVAVGLYLRASCLVAWPCALSNQAAVKRGS